MPTREELIQREADRQAKKRRAREKTRTPERIDQILEEERQREARRVEEGERWAKTAANAAKIFLAPSAKPTVEYIGFQDGRRTFRIEA